MREILFRGIIKSDNSRYKRGQWAVGDLVRLQDGNDGKPHIYSCGEVFAESVGQYTGLTDKNGKKIFEGDIVNFKTTNCHIKYQSCYGRYCAIDNKGCEYPTEKTFEYEIIGNIHDNPELLKEREGE